ncbi:MAG TPA: hypothetical protein VE994_09085 [Terriglobales bacterium]|nr:hypothetical protein [Terriglobales bacterium]
MLMTRLHSAIAITVLLLACFGTLAAENPDEPYKFFRDVAGLDESQISAIRSGKAVAKVVDSHTPDEVLVFGSVYIQAKPESYNKLASDLDSLRKLPSYLAIQSFSNPPQLSDLNAFVLDDQDIRELKNCKTGHCDFQLPTEAIEDFQRSINWSAPDVADSVNRLAQKMALQALLDYMQGGNAALGAYRDKNHPAVVAETFASLVSRWDALPVYLPEFNEYLLQYPKVKSDNVQTGFYWEKVNFGLKPTFRIVQRIVYRQAHANEPSYAVAEKQIYASHYFQTALDLTVCAKDPERPGFYLITLKGSKQAGLTGFKGGIVRKVAVDKSRSSLERVLLTIKQKLESQ